MVISTARAREGHGRADAGAAALEFALVLPVLLALVFGMIEFGFAFQAQLAIVHAAREGARLASVNKYDSGTVVSRAYPLTTGAGLSVSESFPTADSVKVTVTFPYAPQILPWLPSMNLHSEATMRKEY